MKQLLRFSIIFFFLAIAVISDAQNETIAPSKIITPVHFDVSEPLRDIKVTLPGERLRSWKDNVVLNKFGFKDEFKVPSRMVGPDPILQNNQGKMQSAKAVVENFDGVPNISGVAPPDTDGDVGTDHYFQMTNLAFQIFNKDGTSAYGPVDNQTLWEGFDDGQPFDNANDGDPVVVYDEYAQRWLASQFVLNSTNTKYYELMAVSATSDPTGVWYRYAFEFDNFPDYPKIGVWHDGYYMAINQFANASSWAGGGAVVVDRDAMIAGNPTATMVFFDLGLSYGSLLPADADGAALPPVAAPGYFVAMDPNILRIWELDVNWTTPANSSITLTSNLATAAFSYSGISVTQQGSGTILDNLADRLMYRLQYRNFGTHQSMVTNHTVNVGSGRAGVRWYELRNSGSGWTIYQEGTYAPADGLHRWMGSIAMNANGDIGLGYSVSGSTAHPSIRYTGRLSTDPLGTMTLTEQSIFSGSASQSGVSRWGDYSAMTIDPIDDFTFWFTTEYTSGSWNWRTRIASFQFGSLALNANLSASSTNVCVGEPVSFTDLSNGPSAITTWSWSFPGGSPSSYSGQTPPPIVYSSPGMYDVTLSVGDGSDTDTEIKTDYITVSNVIADFIPSSLTVAEGSTLTFTDNSSCSPTEWNWTFTGGAPSSYSGPNPPAITYNTMGDFNVTLEVVKGVNNDTKIIPIEVIPLSYCTPTYSTGTSDGDYISLVQLEDINNATTGASSPYYTYYSSESTDLTQDESYTVTLSPGTYFEGNYLAVWIDYNRDGTFSESTEKLGTILINAAAPATGIINFTVPINANIGTTRMRVRDVYGTSSFDACSQYTWGETEDYDINILGKEIRLDLTAFLEGPFNGANMNMNIITHLPLSQPFNMSPWNYTGTESVGSIPANVVDWVLVDVRDAASAATATSANSEGKQAAFILNDGSIVGLDGSSNLIFDVSIAQNLFAVVWQRNHLGIISNSAITEDGGLYTYDYTTGINQVFGGIDGHKQISIGIWGMIGGDGNHDGQVNANDKSPQWDGEAGEQGYLFGDHNLDGEANNKDKDDIWVPNEGKSSQVPN